MNEESPPPLPPSLHSSHITSHASYIKITADDKKDINGPPLFSFFLFFLPGRRWCCPPILNDWKQGEQRDTKTRREREKGWMRVTLKAERKVIESPLYVHWADKQVAEYIMSMNEKEGTRSLSVPLHLFDTPPSHVLVSLFWVRVKQWLLILMLT